MYEDTKQRVIEIVQEVFGLFVDIDDDEDFVARSYGDSLDMVEFAMELEDAFDIETIDDSDIPKLNTINKVIYYIEHGQELPPSSSITKKLYNFFRKKK